MKIGALMTYPRSSGPGSGASRRQAGADSLAASSTRNSSRESSKIPFSSAPDGGLAAAAAAVARGRSFLPFLRAADGMADVRETAFRAASAADEGDFFGAPEVTTTLPSTMGSPSRIQPLTPPFELLLHGSEDLSGEAVSVALQLAKAVALSSRRSAAEVATAAWWTIGAMSCASPAAAIRPRPPGASDTTSKGPSKPNPAALMVTGRLPGESGGPVEGQAIGFEGH